MKKLFLLATAICCVSVAEAKVVLPSMISDDMVLQRDQNVKIWGKAEASKTVTVIPSWSGVKYTAESDAEGNWSVMVNTTGVGGPYTIRLSDGEDLVLHNILLGDVWICSGQSNMDMNFGEFNNQPVENALQTVVESEKYKNIRMFTVKQKSSTPQETCGGKWEMPNMETMPHFSALAYFYAKSLNEVLDIPIGVVHNSWGGSMIEQWMSGSEANYAKYPHFREMEEKVKMGKKGADPFFVPSNLYNGMLYPLRHMAIKGFTWYQGEANVDNYQDYASMFEDMVKEWRALFPDAENAPFYYVQISPYYYGDSEGDKSAFLREAQAKGLSIPNTGMVITLDVGEERCIHPAKKEIVGQRLAYKALAGTYHKPVPADYPVLREVVPFEKGKLRLFFDHADGGLCPLWGNLDGFEVAGEDGRYYPAQTLVRYGDKMEVWSEKVPEPKYVRYGFRNYFKPTLFNAYNLPAAQFRTDNFPPKPDVKTKAKRK